MAKRGMTIRISLLFLLIIGLNIAISACAELPDALLTDNNPYCSVSNNFIRTFYSRIQDKPEAYVRKEIGKLNTIKRAYQLTDFHWVPADTLCYNIGYYSPGEEYIGVPYSSVKELGTYVGNNISLYTFSTAIINPRSKLYTVKINETPYHGTNCKSYYGTVCSSLVSYALGLKFILGSYDFVDSDMMIDVGYEKPEDVEVGDVLWVESHVAIITDILFSSSGKVEMVEFSEAVPKGCVRKQLNRFSFDELMHSRFEKVLRYKYIEENTFYDPHPEIVAVAEETPIPLRYDNSICVDKGDCANYLFDEDVIVNIFSPYDSIVVFKDNTRFTGFVPKNNQGDITMKDLPYGTYHANLYYGHQDVVTTKWIVVDYKVSFNKESREVSFRSHNAKPIIVKLCSLDGSRKHSAKELLNRCITEEEMIKGLLFIPDDKYVDDNYSCIQVLYNTEYGTISTLPIKATN